MATATGGFVAVGEYLSSSYSPDCDYVDGVLVERNVGPKDHSRVQTELAYFFRSRRNAWKLNAGVAQRVQTGPERFRVPDVCVTLDPEPEEQVFHTPPFLCIEVLSPDDRMSELEERIEDYLRFGVPNVWVIDPKTRTGYAYSPNGGRHASRDMLKTADPEFEVPLSEIFAALK